MPRDPELAGKVALVTGASRGIGAAVARAFCRAGVAFDVFADDYVRHDFRSSEAGAGPGWTEEDRR
jgi:NAD(P)-dependent dehydrogenase (short-subunit alcohol dehydrogenase family)